MAYSEEQRRSALETFIRFDHSYADTIAEVGYPNRGTLRGWWREYERTGAVPVRKSVSDPTYTDAMKRAAVDHYLGHGRSLARTARALGYPKSRQLLGEWIDEYAPGQRKRRGPGPDRGPVPLERKVQVVAELEARTGTAAEVAERNGVSRAAPYAWRREIMGNNGGRHQEKGLPVAKEIDELYLYLGHAMPQN
jgi:transposase-like protein